MPPSHFFNYQSLRARKARLARHLSHTDTYWLLAVTGTIMMATGVAVVWLQHSPWGWLLAGFAGPFWVGAAWSRALRDIPPRARMQTIDDVVDADVLGLLPAEHTPKQLAEIAMQLPGGQFFAARFELGSEFLHSMNSDRPGDSVKVWQDAEHLRSAYGLSSISAATLAVALMHNTPDIDAFLAPVRISENDILDGLKWYNHLQAVIAAHHNRPHDGGIGRDWAFGYTPMLDRFGLNITQHVSQSGLLQNELPSREAVLDQMVHLISQAGRHNVALVGGLGAGKTQIVHELARKLTNADPRIPRHLHYWQVVSLDASTLISQAKGRGELEELVHRLCYEALMAKNIILFLDDAQLFFEDGNGAVNLSNVLFPILDGGALPLILAMDEQRWLRISQNNPGLSQHLNRVMIPPTNEDETMLVMQDTAIIYEHQQRVTYTYQALAAIYRLSNRYMSEQVMPGRALKLLEAAANSPEDGFVTHRSVEKAIEQTQGVKVGTADTAVERETLLNLEQLIHKRMINQTRAVRVVSDALRRARAGVRNASRPIGTFLFLGPTGVGKTELAKSVAAVFFGGENNIIRLDLNEYVRPEDVSRLLADAAQDQHSLTAQIARNPFSVVLLDEIEKAHPNVLNTLLQMLDEGILRDINNREVSFRDAVVIATSNAGAERIRQHIDAGEQLDQFEAEFTNELISANVFRPEFLNRFDEIVLFRPLTREELVQVIDLILKGVNKNLAAQRVSVTVDEDAKRLLVQSGYDPRLGARPMRRVVQRVVENIVSNQLLSGQAVPGSKVHVTAADVQIMLQRGQS